MPEFWTEEDLTALPEDGRRYEILDGNLIVTPPASYEHQNIGFNLAFRLRLAVPEGWKVLPEIGVRVPGGNFVPDVVVLKPGATPSVDWHKASDVALVVEIASPSTERHDRGDKAIAYAQAGIPAYWRIARDGTLYVHTLTDVGQYGIVEIVKPGQTWTALYPFEVTIDPEALTA
jgi:Uma2 family endonuclease